MDSIFADEVWGTVVYQAFSGCRYGLGLGLRIAAAVEEDIQQLE
jgi:hypothetical protein